MNKYLQRGSTLVHIEGDSFIQCEVCGQCFSLQEWVADLVKESDKYGFTCSHQVKNPGELIAQ